MTRQKDPGAFDAFVELVALLPWWAGVGLAVACYFVLHAVATSPPAGPADIHHLSGALSGAILRGLAIAGQYLLPIFFIMGAGVGVWGRHRRRALVGGVADSDSADSLNKMSWREFEMTVSEAFRLDGFRVEERGGAAPDGGIDLVLYRGADKFLVQCKQWRARTVPVGVVRELYGVMAAEQAAGGFVVTSGRFTPDAIDFAEGKTIVLVDGPMLFDMIKNAKRAPMTNVRVTSAPTNK